MQGLKLANLYIFCRMFNISIIHCQFEEKTCPEIVFKKTEITSVLFTEDITNFTVSNVQECANSCPDYPACRSFGFDVTSLPKVCYLYRNHVYWGQPGLNYSSVYYYWQVERKCPVDQGYIFNATLHVCYKLVSLAVGGKSWLGAQSECEKTNGNLYIADTNDKILMIQDVINNEYSASDVGEFIFVGTNDLHLESLYYWLNGESITNWEMYQPDNFEGRDNCGALRYRNFSLGLIDTNSPHSDKNSSKNSGRGGTHF